MDDYAAPDESTLKPFRYDQLHVKSHLTLSSLIIWVIENGCIYVVHTDMGPPSLHFVCSHFMLCDVSVLAILVTSISQNSSRTQYGFYPIIRFYQNTILIWIGHFPQTSENKPPTSGHFSWLYWNLHKRYTDVKVNAGHCRCLSRTRCILCVQVGAADTHGIQARRVPKHRMIQVFNTRT